MKALLYDLDILRSLTSPITTYSLKKKYQLPYSSTYVMLQRYQVQGIVRVSKEETSRARKTVRYYELTDSGHLLLKLAEDVEKRNSNQRSS